MSSTDIAERVYRHFSKFDPIIRSLLDTDFYKLLMLQMIWGLYHDTKVTFTLLNRNQDIPLTEEIAEEELREQLDHVRNLRFTNRELVWLGGNSFYNQKNIFHADFLLWLKDFQLPPYILKKHGAQYYLSFEGPWRDVTMWEIPALAIINELRARAAIRNMGRFSLDVLYARAKAKMWSKVERLQKLEDIKIADFGTRRRHSFHWHRWCVNALKEGLGNNFIGSSNVFHAMEHDLEAVGTNAHELPMVLAALADNEEQLKQAPYQVLKDWCQYYHGNLLILLPDTFGTKGFLKRAPSWAANWKGLRLDSADPIKGGEAIIDWWRSEGQDPREKLLVFSDSLNVETIERAYHNFKGRVQMSFGWGTNLTNDFKACAPLTTPRLEAASLVCKVTCANGRPAVKLSDNLTKATGDPRAIQQYLKVFRGSLL